MDCKDIQLSRKEKMLIICGLAAASLVLGYLFYNSMLPMGCVPLLYIPARNIYREKKMRERMIKIRAGFKDMLYSLSSSYLAGKHMREALIIAEKELAQLYSANEPIMEELRNINTRMNQPEVSENQVLTEFLNRNEMEEIRDFVTAYRMMVSSGGDMSAMMNRCAKIIGEKISAEDEIKEIVSQRKTEGIMITLMPVIVILFLRMTSPGYLMVMYETLPGVIVMTAVLGIIYMAYRAIDKITDIDV